MFTEVNIDFLLSNLGFYGRYHFTMTADSDYC